MFGATASVYAFKRASRSLWFLMNRMLHIPCGVFFDDFPMFSPVELCDSADESASELLDILGWLHAKTGPKGKPFESSFDVLGCNLNLAGVPEGYVTLENKQGEWPVFLNAYVRFAARVPLVSMKLKSCMA